MAKIKMICLLAAVTISTFFLSLATEKSVEVQACGSGEFFNTIPAFDHYENSNGCVTFDEVMTSGDGGEAAEVAAIEKYFNSFATRLAGVASGVAVLVLVWAGIMYAASGGDPKKTEQAKGMMKMATIGFFMSFLSFVILSIVKSIF